MGVEPGKAFAVVDGFTHDDHGGEGEVVAFDYFREVLEFAPVYAFVRPGEVVAGGDGGGRRVVLHQLGLNLVDDGGAEEDAHGAL